MSASPRLRCAVYTRKSTDEGLDQEFNSLDAQREACAAYIASQTGLGWKLVPDHYDDGGISGGTMDRPALQRLLSDIRDKRVDVVVVYRHIFARYLELRSVRALVEECAAQGLKGRQIIRTDGTGHSGKPFGRGNLYHLLSNSVYVGKIRHRDQLYDGQHEPIVDHETFDEAQALLATQAPRRRSNANHPDVHLLTGILFDETGDRLSPAHASKQGVRYRYYISNRLSQAHRKDGDGWRVPAKEVESLVERQVIQILRNEAQIADWIQQTGSAAAIHTAVRQAAVEAETFGQRASSERRRIIRRIFLHIVLKPHSVRFEIGKLALVEWLINADDALQSERVDQHGQPDQSGTHAIELPIMLKRRGVEQRIVLQNGMVQSRAPDAALVELVARARRYLDCLTSGACRSLTEVASKYKTDLSEVSRILPLAFLAPKIVDAIIAGEQPIDLTAQRLSRLPDLPLAWHEQIDALGF